jgi:hypothetical protein
MPLRRSRRRAPTGPRRIERAPLIQAAPAGRSWFAGLGLDIRLAFRLLRQQPGFAFISIAMIALAIAAATSLFSVVNGVLLKPLPQIRTDGLMRVFESRDTDPTWPKFTNVTYYAWVEKPETIEGLAAWNDVSLPHDGPSGVQLLRGARITANLFPVLGISPILGQSFTEDQEVADDSVILSYGFWKERYAAAPDALGQRLTIGGKPRTIVAVMPNGFAFPDRDARLWLAQRVPRVITRESRNKVSMTISGHNALARLKPGFTAEQAAAEGGARIQDAQRNRARGFGNDGPRRRPAPTTKITLTPMLDLWCRT